MIIESESEETIWLLNLKDRKKIKQNSKQIELFNQPLLQKQVWRILKNPLLLISRFLRGIISLYALFWELPIQSLDSFWKDLYLREGGIRKRS